MERDYSKLAKSLADLETQNAQLIQENTHFNRNVQELHKENRSLHKIEQYLRLELETAQKAIKNYQNEIYDLE